MFFRKFHRFFLFAILTQPPLSLFLIETQSKACFIKTCITFRLEIMKINKFFDEIFPTALKQCSAEDLFLAFEATRMPTSVLELFPVIRKP